VSISSTFYVRIFRMNVVLSTFFLVTCRLHVQRSYEKRAHIKLMKLTAGVTCIIWLDCHYNFYCFLQSTGPFSPSSGWSRDLIPLINQLFVLLFKSKKSTHNTLYFCKENSSDFDMLKLGRFAYSGFTLG